MIVVDANILGYLITPSPQTQEVLELRLRDSEWISPPLWRSEITNLMALLVRHHGLSRTHALEALRHANAIMQLPAPAVEAEEVLDLSIRSKCTAYDCEYIYVAKVTGLPLVTYDKELLRAFPRVAMTPKNYIATQTN